MCAAPSREPATSTNQEVHKYCSSDELHLAPEGASRLAHCIIVRHGFPPWRNSATVAAMRSAVLVPFLLGATATLAGAQPSPLSAKPPSPELQAGRFADAASVALKGGDFDTAIDLFAKAYKAVPLPVYLFDIAQANRKKSEALHDSDPVKSAECRDTARDYYGRFLATHPKEEELEIKARGLKARLDDQWAVEHPKEEASRLVEEARRRAAAERAEQARLLEAQRAERERAAQIRSAVTKTQRENARSKARAAEIAGIAAMTLGAASAGTAVYLGIQARTIANRLTREDVYDQRLISEGQRDEQQMWIAYAAGGTLLVGGAVALWLGHRISERDEDATGVMIAPAPHGGAVLMHGTF